MKKRRHNWRRRAKWLGSCTCAAILLALVASIWIRVRYDGAVGRSPSFAPLYVFERGSIAFGEAMYPHGRRGPPVGISIDSASSRSMVWLPGRRSAYIARFYSESVYQIPLWIPLLLVGVPTLWLWRTDRRAKAWECAKCRYDLRGIDSTVCPECGNSTENAS